MSTIWMSEKIETPVDAAHAVSAILNTRLRQSLDILLRLIHEDHHDAAKTVADSVREDLSMLDKEIKDLINELGSQQEQDVSRV